MTTKELERKVIQLEKEVYQLKGALEELLGEKSAALIMQKKRTEWLQRENLKETCEFLRNIASELEDEKVKFPTRAFKNWLNMVESSRDPEEYCEGILSVEKLSVGDLISIFEKNRDTLIKKIRGFGPSAYEKIMLKLKGKATD